MKNINIAKSIAQQLRNRDMAHKIRQIACESNEPELTLDFSDVDWISRSFMDEFVEEIIDNPPCKIQISNMNELSQKMLEVVKRTHHNPIGSFIQSNPEPQIVPFVF